MDSLIAEMRDLESSSTGVAGPVQSAPVSQLAFQEDSASWEDQFIGTGSANTPFQVSHKLFDF